MLINIICYPYNYKFIAAFLVKIFAGAISLRTRWTGGAAQGYWLAFANQCEAADCIRREALLRNVKFCL